MIKSIFYIYPVIIFFRMKFKINKTVALAVLLFSIIAIVYLNYLVSSI